MTTTIKNIFFIFIRTISLNEMVCLIQDLIFFSWNYSFSSFPNKPR